MLDTFFPHQIGPTPYHTAHHSRLDMPYCPACLRLNHNKSRLAPPAGRLFASPAQTDLVLACVRNQEQDLSVQR